MIPVFKWGQEEGDAPPGDLLSKCMFYQPRGVQHRFVFALNNFKFIRVLSDLMSGAEMQDETENR